MVNFKGNKSGFDDELMTASLNAHIQMKFPYVVNTDLLKIDEINGGTAVIETTMLKVQTSTAVDGSCVVETKDVLNYQPGQGMRVRWSCQYSTGVVDSEQESGLGDSSDFIGFGYSGSSFGIIRRVDDFEVFIDQYYWSERASLTLIDFYQDWTKINFFQIVIDGNSTIYYYCQDSRNGEYVLVHRTLYAGLYLEPNLYNLCLPFRYAVENNGNDTNIFLKSISCAGFKEGSISHVSRNLLAVDNTKTVTTETNIITLDNSGTFLSVRNRIPLKIDNISCATDGSKTAVIRVYKNATLGGTPSYTSVNSNSAASYDVAGTTVTGGTLIFSTVISKVNSENIDFNNKHLFLYPGETLTISAVSSASNEIFVSIAFEVED